MDPSNEDASGRDADKNASKPAASENGDAPKASQAGARRQAQDARTEPVEGAGGEPKPERPDADVRRDSSSSSGGTAESSERREALVQRLLDTRRTAMVVLFARAVIGAIVTLILASIVALLLWIFPLFRARPMEMLASLAGAAGLLVGAWRGARESMPEAAAKLGFLRDRAFVWLDPFNEQRPHRLPFWIEPILWGPNQVLTGVVPFRRIHRTERADAEAAADVAREMAKATELDLTDGLTEGSPKERGLRFLLLLRLAGLAVEDGRLKGRVSGLGQAELFQGTVG